MPKKHLITPFFLAAALTATTLALAQAAPLMIVGNDEKLLWDDAGKPLLSPTGKTPS